MKWRENLAVKALAFTAAVGGVHTPDPKKKLKQYKK